MNSMVKISSTLTTEIGLLSEQLSVAENDLIEQCVLSLISFGMVLPSTIKPDDIRKVYGFSLSGIASGAITKATEKLMRGEYGPEYSEFIPNPPRLASLAQVEQMRIVADLARERAIEAAIKDGKQNTTKATNEEWARVREKLAAFKLQNAEFKRSNDKGPQAASEPITQERIEFLKAILALKDRGTVTEEERQHRARAATLIASGVP